MQRGMVTTAPPPPRSRDLTPCDFLVWDIMKNNPPPLQEAEEIGSNTSDHRVTVSEGAWKRTNVYALPLLIP